MMVLASMSRGRLLDGEPGRDGTDIEEDRIMHYGILLSRLGKRSIA